MVIFFFALFFFFFLFWKCVHLAPRSLQRLSIDAPQFTITTSLKSCFFSSLLFSLLSGRARIWAGREIPLPSLVKRNTRPVQKEERKKKTAAHFVANGKSRGEDAPFNGDRSKNGFDFRWRSSPNRSEPPVASSSVKCWTPFLFFFFAFSFPFFSIPTI